VVAQKFLRSTDAVMPNAPRFHQRAEASRVPAPDQEEILRPAWERFLSFKTPSSFFIAH
jgi:hypothetical protein